MPEFIALNINHDPNALDKINHDPNALDKINNCALLLCGYRENKRKCTRLIFMLDITTSTTNKNEKH